MKITVKISLQQLEALVQSFNHIAAIPLMNREQKVRRSCLDRIVIKLKKKHVEEAYKANLFTSKKKLTFSMEFDEAHFLENFLTIIDEFPLNDYDRNVLMAIRHDLNQKLA